MTTGHMDGVPNQENSQENSFTVNRDFIFANQETVLDFFGDNRDTWYRKLQTPGIKYPKVNLDDSQAVLNTLPEDEDKPADLQPLSLRLLLDKVDSVVAFFEEVPEAKEALRQYHEHGQREKKKDLHPALDDLYGASV